ncbi:MAG: hypothetical protein ACYCX4_14330 [Bacillota bacterium]
MKQPLIKKLNIWERHEKEVLIILTEALNALRGEVTGLESEDDITRALILKMRSINRERLKNGRGINNTISGQMVNQPRYEDELGQSRERKIPDIQWGFVNPHATNPDYFERQYCIECKCLGQPLNSRCSYYVNNGIQRFLTVEHGYAKGECSSTMIGYVLSLDLDTILDKVNLITSEICIPELVLKQDHWNEYGVSNLGHWLNRVELKPSDFYLHHFWVDLRPDNFSKSTA